MRCWESHLGRLRLWLNQDGRQVCPWRLAKLRDFVPLHSHSGHWCTAPGPRPIPAASTAWHSGLRVMGLSTPSREGHSPQD